jgi:hypothetical protein
MRFERLLCWFERSIRRAEFTKVEINKKKWVTRVETAPINRLKRILCFSNVVTTWSEVTCTLTHLLVMGSNPLRISRASKVTTVFFISDGHETTYQIVDTILESDGSNFTGGGYRELQSFRTPWPTRLTKWPLVCEIIEVARDSRFVRLLRAESRWKYAFQPCKPRFDPKHRVSTPSRLLGDDWEIPNP